MMNVQDLLNQFLGGGEPPSNTSNSLTSNLPGGLMGGAAAGGLMALLVGSKGARKFAGKAATYGGAAVLAGLAYGAYKQWQTKQSTPEATRQAADSTRRPLTEQSFSAPQTMSAAFQLRLIKAMISAAHSDGFMTQTEQRKIFDTLEKMALPTELKALIFDALRQPESAEQLAMGIHSLEQKTELYLASCLAMDAINQAEQAYLERLANALSLPDGLAYHLQQQAQQALLSAA